MPSCKEAYVKPVYFPLTDETCVIPQSINILLQPDQIAKIFNKPSADIRIVPNAYDQMRMKGFALWDESAYDNNKGIYLSIAKNAYIEYGENYISDMITSMKEKGETDAEGGRVFYKEFDAVGTSGAYSHELNTYAWEMQNCILFKLVFNTSHSESEQYKLAVKTARLITDNYMNYIASLEPKS